MTWELAALTCVALAIYLTQLTTIDRNPNLIRQVLSVALWMASVAFMLVGLVLHG